MRLPDLQRHMAESILLNDSSAVSAQFACGRISASDALLIYHQNVAGGLAEALGSTFSATKALVGTPFFETMARRFVREHPPQQADINGYGKDFEKFVRHYEPARLLPYLADVVHFEWAWNGCFREEDDSPLAMDVLTAIPASDYPSLRLKLRASARLVISDYPVDALWRYCENGGSGSVPDVHGGGVHLLLLRPEREALIIPLSPAEYQALAAISSGASCEDAFTPALEHDQGFDTESFFTRHFALGTFAAIV